MRRLLPLLLLAACGSEQPYTWGEASEQFAAAYCSAYRGCGYDIDQELCIEHTAWHVCRDNRTCDTEVDESATVDALIPCTEAFARLDEFGCYALVIWGALPAGCMSFWDLQP